MKYIWYSPQKSKYPLYIYFRCLTSDGDIDCSHPLADVLIASDSLCGLIKNQNQNAPFKECLDLIANSNEPNAAEDYYQDCYFDVCAYMDDVDGRKEQACNALSTFMDYCYDTVGSGSINFRTSTFCPGKVHRVQLQCLSLFYR